MGCGPTAYLRNDARTTIPTGTVVQITNNNAISPADAALSTDYRAVLGITLEAISSGSYGYVRTTGHATTRMDSGLVPTAGSVVYLSPTNAGQGTTAPPAPQQCKIGLVRDTTRYGIDQTVVIELQIDTFIASSASPMDIYVERGLNLVNFTDKTAGGLVVFKHDMDNWATSVFGGGNISTGSQSYIGSGKTGGWLRLITSANPSCGYQSLWAALGIYTSVTPGWYFAARMMLPDPMDSHSFALVGLQDATNNVSIGAGWCLNLHATNFVVQYDGWCLGTPGSALNLGVAADTNAHIFEMWCQPGSNILYARIDGGTIVSALQSTPPVSRCMTPFAFVYNNGSTGTNHIQDIDWAVCIAQRD